MAKNTVCVWYDKDAEAAARFYAETFSDSAVGAVGAKTRGHLLANHAARAGGGDAWWRRSSKARVRRDDGHEEHRHRRDQCGTARLRCATRRSPGARENNQRVNPAAGYLDARRGGRPSKAGTPSAIRWKG